MSTVFLDLDGTLTDPAPGIVACLQHAITCMSGPTWTDAALLRFIGPPLESAFREILGTTDGELAWRAIEHYRERFSERGLFENRVYPGIVEALALLRQSGFELMLVTSKPQPFAERIVEHFGLGGFLSRVYGSELSGERGDKAALIAHVLRSERIDPRAAWMVGDRSYDIVGAKANGVVSLGVLWGYGTRAELCDAGADALVETVGELAVAVQSVKG